MLLTLIRPTVGRVELFGRSLQRHRSAALQRVGGLVERARFLPLPHGPPEPGDRGIAARRHSHKDIDRVLDIVGLSARANDKVKAYSHGMKQRLGIAQALLGAPEFVVLDEPTTGLDRRGSRKYGN